MINPYSTLEYEAEWLMEEYEQCFGVHVEVAPGAPFALVHGMQAAIVRYYVEKMKAALE